jgi:regulator of nucleoside diphosphate kinase
MSHLNTQPPPISIISDDLRLLCTLCLTRTEAAEFLAREIDRARIVPVHQASQDLVRMGSTVKYRDNTTGKISEATLVYPRDADGEPNHLPVLTVVGAALIGLSVGQTTTFATRKGEVRSLSVLEVIEGGDPHQ